MQQREPGYSWPQGGTLDFRSYLAKLGPLNSKVILLYLTFSGARRFLAVRKKAGLHPLMNHILTATLLTQAIPVTLIPAMGLITPAMNPWIRALLTSPHVCEP